MPEGLPEVSDPGFFTRRGCVMLAGIFASLLGIAAGVYYAVQGYTEGLLLVIVILLALILMQLSTRR